MELEEDLPLEIRRLNRQEAEENLHNIRLLLKVEHDFNLIRKYRKIRNQLFKHLLDLDAIRLEELKQQLREKGCRKNNKAYGPFTNKGEFINLGIKQPGNANSVFKEKQLKIKRRLLFCSISIGKGKHYTIPKTFIGCSKVV